MNILNNWKSSETLVLDEGLIQRLLGLNSLSELDQTYLSKDYAFDSKNVLSAFPLIDEGY